MADSERHAAPESRVGVQARPALAGVAALRPEHGPLLLVVGVFDGLHRGHAYLLRELRRASVRMDVAPAVLTFDHHPDEIVAGAAPPLLCDPHERLARLAQAGVEVTIVEHFDEALRRTPYDAFVGSIQARTRLAGLLMTPDAAFGHERRGTPETLAALGARAGFRVVVVPPFEIDGRQVRSAEIRSAIASGDLAAARALLGRRVAVTGQIAARTRTGQAGTLRFPVPVALPPPGRYVATLEPAIAPGAPPARPHAALVRVDQSGTLDVHARAGTLAPGRLRVAFVGPA
jgi:riboflavin kinase/FMN adenylyltransferase